MPAVVSSTVRFGEDIGGGKSYFIYLDELTRVFPHIEEGKMLRFYISELRNENDKLIKRFKPFREVELKIGRYWNRYWNRYVPCLIIPRDMASQLNIGDDYRITIIITAYDGKPFLPLELKLVDRESERAFEHFSRIEAGLLSLSLEDPLLNEAVSYLWDAYARLEENDVEGARTSIRNSLRDVIRDKFVPRIEVVGEAEEFPERVKRLLSSLIELVQYGGPHPGPAPRSTTEMALSMGIELVRYLAKMLEDRVISLKKEGEAGS
ncbi:MAG: hypothetical protein DSO07_06330 [Thermoproteota archaeon]|jgi:hypothetical protein|nr:MAG: hypothetical protein DSO07_06330 [Candidatus Korarchaeota archaeon]